MHISREGYERVLRRLVLDSTDRIKWLTGTVTGFNVNPGDESILSSVEVRLPDGKTNLTAALVIGWYRRALCIVCNTLTMLMLRFPIRLHRGNAGWLQTSTSHYSPKREGNVTLERFKTIL